MSIFELFVAAVGLSMDAFAVSISKGLVLPKIRLRNAFTVGAYFGSFQAAMPVIGYFTMRIFSASIVRYGHWIAFLLLLLIGANMIKESFGKDCNPAEHADKALRFSVMVTLAVATSIDALAVGATLAFLSVNIYLAAVIIGVTTLLFSMLGVKIGNIFGHKYKSKAELIGGVILILMGIKILLEHLGVIKF